MTSRQLVLPFSGQVVQPEWAARVVSPLHDVLSLEERQAVIAANPDSYLHVTSNPHDLPLSATGDDPWSANQAALQRLLDLGAYGPPVEGSAFVYRMTEAGQEHTGVAAQVAVRGFVDGGVLGHEGVRPQRVMGLVRHFDRVPRRSELVSLVHRGGSNVAELITAATQGPPQLELTDLSGVAQSVWPVDQEASTELVRRLGARQLYIADGHHRVAASVHRWVRDGRPLDASVLCSIYAEEQIRLYAFHRRVRGPVDAALALDALAATYVVRAVPGPVQVRGRLGMYAAGRWHELVPRWPRAVPDPAVAPGVAGLDVTLLDETVLRPVLGLAEADRRLEFVPELRDLAETLQACDEDGGVVFSLHAPTMDDLVAVASRGEVMSAKSTYVQPKPRTGIFLH